MTIVHVAINYSNVMLKLKFYIHKKKKLKFYAQIYKQNDNENLHFITVDMLI